MHFSAISQTSLEAKLEYSVKRVRAHNNLNDLNVIFRIEQGDLDLDIWHAGSSWPHLSQFKGQVMWATEFTFTGL